MGKGGIMKYKKYTAKQVEDFLEENDIKLDDGSNEALKIISNNCGIKIEFEELSKPQGKATSELIIRIRLREEE